MNQVYSMHWKYSCLLLVLISLSACVTLEPKGNTDQEKLAYLKKYEAQTLKDLIAAHPETEAMIKNSEGYAVLHHSVAKVPIFEMGSGYGVVKDNQNQERSYLSIFRLGVGWGYGGRLNGCGDFF